MTKDPRKSEVEQKRRELEINAERQGLAKLLADARLLKSAPATGHGFDARDLIYRMKEMEAATKDSAAIAGRHTVKPE